jgi:hypothetical protein
MLLCIALPVGIVVGLLHPAAGIAAGLLCAMLIWALSASAETVFKAAVYQYAIGRPVDAFGDGQMRGCFQPK